VDIDINLEELPPSPDDFDKNIFYKIVAYIRYKKYEPVFEKILDNEKLCNIQYRNLGCSVCRDWHEHKILTYKNRFRISICSVCGKEFRELNIGGEWVCLQDLRNLYHE